MKKDSMESALIQWLLEPCDNNVSYLTLRYLLNADKREIEAARQKAHREGPIATILSKMEPEGYWVQPGAGYYPKYTGTVWSVILLSQLGASSKIDKRIATACSYVMEHNLTRDGHFTINGLPSGTADCLQGNLCSALLDLGCNDPRLDKAFKWMARSVTGEGIAPMTNRTATVRYYAGKCGPNFECGSNNKLPCAWGAIKVMRALSKLPQNKRTKLVKNAISTGVDFLFSTDPEKADYPCGYNTKPSRNWWKFGFPVFYVSDILEIVEVLVRLGYGKDRRLHNALKIIREKRDKQGRWLLEYDYTGKTWEDFGVKKQPSKWVTLRALRVLKEIEGLEGN